MIENDLLQNNFVKHVLKHRPNSVTAQLARELNELKNLLKETYIKIDRLEDTVVMHMHHGRNTTVEHYKNRLNCIHTDICNILKDISTKKRRP